MAAQRRRNIVATLLQRFGLTRQASSLMLGPGCTCASCVQAWDRQRPELRTASAPRTGGADEEEQDDDDHGNDKDHDEGSSVHLSRHLHSRNASARASTRGRRQAHP